LQPSIDHGEEEEAGTVAQQYRQSAFFILCLEQQPCRQLILVDITTISRLWPGVKNKINEAFNNQNENGKQAGQCQNSLYYRHQTL
jgi:hypothetical protein